MLWRSFDPWRRVTDHRLFCIRPRRWRVWIYRTSNLSYENGTITGNKAALNGGGVYIQKDDSETITWGSGIAVTENHADHNGGGLYIHSVSDVGNELIFDGLTISTKYSRCQRRWYSGSGAGPFHHGIRSSIL